MPTPPPSAPRRAVLRALASLLVLAAAVIGLPVLLAMVTGPVWASAHDDLPHLLDRQDTGSVFLLALVGIAWIAWAHFTLCVLLEIPAQLRGRSLRPGRLTVSRRAAATLISSILVLLPTGTALATPVSATAASTADPSPGARPADHQAPQQKAAERSSGQRTYTVRDARPAESLWSIAERELGRGELWTTIAELNQGRTMADGSHFDADAFLQPGWTLLLPAADHSDASPPRPHTPTRTVTVAPGDTLSAIAETQLGDPARYSEIFDLNDNPTTPGARTLTDPDQIYPGQRLALPISDPSPGDRPSQRDSERAPSQDHGDRGSSPAPGTTAPSHPGQQTPSPGASNRSENPSHHQRGEDSTQSARPPATPKPTAPERQPDQPAAEPAAHSDGIQMRTIAGIGALLAAIVVGGLGIRRLIQQRRRKPGETIAMPKDTSRLEQALTASATPASAELLDTALRTLAHHADQTGTSLPPVRGARVTPQTVGLLPDEPAAPLPPFTAAEAGWWTLDRQADLLEPDQARQAPAPYPGLATLGADDDGDLHLVNLPQLRTLLIDGDPDQVAAVCAAIALETGMSPWADQADILLVGLGRELPHLLPTSRVRHLPHAAAAVRDLGERLLEAHQDPELGAQLPWMLICATHITEKEAWQLADALDRARGLRVAAVLPADGISPLFPDAVRVDARSTDTPQELEALGVRLRLQAVSANDYQQLVETLAVADEPSRPADGVWENVPSEPDDSTPASLPDDVQAPPEAAAAEGQPPQGDAFPALLGAVGDPAGLRLLSPVAEPQDADPDADSPTTQPLLDPAAAAPAGEQPQDTEDPDDARPDSEAVDVPSGKAGAAPELETSPARDLHAPEIRVLGPLEVTGIGASGHGPKLSELALLLYFRPHRDAVGICEAMDPVTPWSTATLNSRMYGLRNRLGTDAEGNPYVPRRTRGSDPYRLSPAVRCDWTRFQQLAERGLASGSAVSAVSDLEQALGLVRGRPLGGRDLPWAAPLQQEMISRVVDVAHTLATYRSSHTSQHDLDAARRAIAVGIDVEPHAELLYRDWMRIEHRAGNRAGLHSAITALQQANRALDLDLDPETEELIKSLLADPASKDVV
ncbi:LysM peptidoglycan-binding domain-containing protein [Streptomyces sp. BRA346]|uniref:LysM peptidoglycan-binding domain-containing protein n=1 Tax=Streptomyces sp. BRA346 TaxID=2878199 RepID=UPI00406498BD